MDILDPNVVREERKAEDPMSEGPVRAERRIVTLKNEYGEAQFLSGNLWTLDLGPEKLGRATLPLPRDIKETADRLTEYIEFLRFCRAEVRRIRDGAQEAGDD